MEEFPVQEANQRIKQKEEKGKEIRRNEHSEREREKEKDERES